MSRVMESCEDAVNASCPTCRTFFCIGTCQNVTCATLSAVLTSLMTSTAQPDLRFVPAKYHKFIIPSIRRIYIEAGPQNVPHSCSSSDHVEVQDLKDQITALEQRVAALVRDKALLMDRCETSMTASAHHANKERSARLEGLNLKRQVESLKTQLEETKSAAEESRLRYEGLKWKLKDFKNRSVEPLFFFFATTALTPTTP